MSYIIKQFMTEQISATEILASWPVKNKGQLETRRPDEYGLAHYEENEIIKCSASNSIPELLKEHSRQHSESVSGEGAAYAVYYRLTHREAVHYV